MRNKILLIEDDDDTAILIKEFLEEYDFDVCVISTITDAISNIKFNKYSLVLLDLNLPDFEGYEFLKFIHKNRINISVIVISAYSDKNSKLQAFRLGACDYMIKPIDPEELEARIWVHLKNNSLFIEKVNKSRFQINDNLIIFEDSPLRLTKTEFEILKYLIQNKNQTVSRDKLLDFLSSIVQSDRSLDYHIKNIRIKLGDNGSNPKYLLTEYGMGYKLIF
jgi:DNA-binding response OmpR family regulator